MKKTLLSIALLGAAFVANSQTFFNETFDTYQLGALGTNTDGLTVNQGGWYIFGGSTPQNTSSNLVSVGTNDNALKVTGSATSGYRVITKYFYNSWLTRTSGNNTVFASFMFKTPSANTTSKNFFNVGLIDTTLNENITLGINYTASSKILAGTFYDSLKTSSTATVGTKASFAQKLGSNNTDLVLTNDHIYYFELIFDKTSEDIYWYGVDITNPQSPSMVTFIYRTLVKKKQEVAGFQVVSSSGNTTASPNTSSADLTVDDIIVKARPCVDYDTKASASFSYPAGNYCLGGANLTPVLVAPSSKGTFTSTNGLTLNATTGVVGLGSTTTAGTYTVKFVTADPYVAATATTQGVDGACPDSSTVSITIKNCAGIEEIIENKFSIYPNPANDVVTVSLGDLVITEGTIRLLSADGKVIESREFNNSTIENFDVTSLKSGIYFFQIGNTTEKFIIK